MLDPTDIVRDLKKDELKEEKTVMGSSRPTEGVSNNMRVYQKRTRVFDRAVMILLLVFAMAGTRWAQTLPKPTVPPTPATLPTAQTVAPGFDDLGFIQYMSVDKMCDPAPAAPPLDTTPGAIVTAAPAPPPPTPAGCKTSAGWLQINNDIIRIPANTVVFFPNTD